MLFLTAILLIALWSCNKSTDYEKEESELIQNYLSTHDTLDFVLKPSGLYYLEVLPGSGQELVAHDTAYVKYIGAFLGGGIFDTNVGTTDTLVVPVNEGLLISGFDEALTYMKEGGRAVVILPSSLAYGPYGSYPYIPGFTPLLFDIAVVKVKHGPGK